MVAREHRWSWSAAALCALLSGCPGAGGSPAPATNVPRDSGNDGVSTPATKAAERPVGIVPQFRMIGAESGFDFQRFDDISPKRRILEVNGGGVALLDFDGDGLSDLFLTNGCRLPREATDHETPSVLFRNHQGMRFELVTAPSRIARFGFASGCAVGDFDSDGFADLYVAAFGRNSLWRNNGDGTFDDVTETTGTEVPLWSTSAAFADVNRDGHPDLCVVNYLDESDSLPRLCLNPESPDGYEGCSPAVFDGVDDVLLVSDGAGRFRDATVDAGMAGRRGKGLGVVIADLDADLWPEIYVANDGQANSLFTHTSEKPDGLPPAAGVRFVEQGLSSGLALNESGFAQASMGVAAGDYDGNGTTDLFLTHFFGDTNTLYVNDGGLRFEDKTRGCGAGPTSRGRLGFGTEFFDVDNDGWLDLIIANGHVDDRTWLSNGEPYRMPPELYRNEGGGALLDVSQWSGDYFRGEWLGRGLAVGDLDRDGRVDAVISHQLAPSVILQNQTPTENRSLTLRLTGGTSSRDGVGVRVEMMNVGSIVRDLHGGGSFQSASALEIHLGMKSAPTAALRIHWPSGRIDTHAALTPGLWRLSEGGGAYSLP